MNAHRTYNYTDLYSQTFQHALNKLTSKLSCNTVYLVADLLTKLISKLASP